MYSLWKLSNQNVQVIQIKWLIVMFKWYKQNDLSYNYSGYKLDYFANISWPNFIHKHGHQLRTVDLSIALLDYNWYISSIRLLWLSSFPHVYNLLCCLTCRWGNTPLEEAHVGGNKKLVKLLEEARSSQLMQLSGSSWECHKP